MASSISSINSSIGSIISSSTNSETGSKTSSSANYPRGFTISLSKNFLIGSNIKPTTSNPSITFPIYYFIVYNEIILKYQS